MKEGSRVIRNTPISTWVGTGKELRDKFINPNFIMLLDDGHTLLDNKFYSIMRIADTQEYEVSLPFDTETEAEKDIDNTIDDIKTRINQS